MFKQLKEEKVLELLAWDMNEAIKDEPEELELDPMYKPFVGLESQLKDLVRTILATVDSKYENLSAYEFGQLMRLINFATIKAKNYYKAFDLKQIYIAYRKLEKHCYNEFLLYTRLWASCFGVKAYDTATSEEMEKLTIYYEPKRK